MSFTIEVSSPWFKFIQDGRKPVEGRKGTPRWLAITSGMSGMIINPETKETFSVKCVDVKRYSSLREYLETETLDRTLPGISTIEDGMSIYYQWSTPAEIEQYGFLGIHLEVI
jgi:ASC-1-like (ASCH) protein